MPDRPTADQHQGREIIVDSGSRSIWGHYPLFDLVSLTTTSGSIAVSLTPQPADPEKPNEPARVFIKTESGSVSFGVNTGISSIEDEERQETYYVPTSSSASSLPPRPYEVEVHTGSGSINGRFLFSSSAKFSTDKGSINAFLIPVSYHEGEGQDPVISTSAKYGSQNIRLLEPVVFIDNARHEVQQQPFNIPTAFHTSTHGSVNVHYPAHWAGKVNLRTSKYGHSCLNGKGLWVEKKGDGKAFAVKDPDNSSDTERRAYDWWGGRGNFAVYLETIESGSINFLTA